MPRHPFRHHLLAPLLVLLLAAPAAGGGDAATGALSYIDRQYMDSQRELVEELTTRHFGSGFSGDRDRDLRLLQRLLDERLVRGDQTRELQAIGVILGDLLAVELGLHWVVYRDRLGRSRALRDGDSDLYLFPITMISRRREVDNRTPVAEIYRKARDIVLESRPPLPFQ